MAGKSNELSRSAEDKPPEKLELIKRLFRNIDLTHIKNREFPYSVSVDFAYLLFRQINLDKYKHFIDLGSGDGRVVFTAELFTNAGGIEIDKERYNLSLKMKKKIRSTAGLTNSNYLDMDLSKYDVFYINPDDNIYDIEKKLKREAKKNSLLIVCSELYKPVNLTLADTVKISSFRAFIYTL